MKIVSLADGLESPYILLLEARWQDYRQADAISNLQPHGLAEVLQGLLWRICGLAIEDGFDCNAITCCRVQCDNVDALTCL